MEIIYPCAFFIISFVHLLCCFFEKNKMRCTTKLMLMPLLLLIYLDLTSSKGTDNSKRSKLIVNGLILGFSGDALLILKSQKCFIFGLVSFLFGHFLYVMEMLKRLGDISNIPLFVIIELLHFSIFCYYYYASLHYGFKNEMAYYGFIYGVALSFLNSFAVYSLFMNYCFQNILLVIGTTNFCISDSILAYHTFVKKIKYGQFYLMGTYIAAQTFIALGMSL